MGTETLATLVARLNRTAYIQESDDQFPPTILEELITDAAGRHNESYVVGSSVTVPSAEARCVVYLAAEQVFIIRAAKFATVGDISGASGYGADAKTPFDKCKAMSKWFADLYIAECAKLGISVATVGIGVSDSVVKDRASGITLPLGKAPNSDGSVSLFTTATTVAADGSLVLNFSFSGISNVAAIYVFASQSEDETISQPWDRTSTPVPGISSEAELAGTITDLSQKQLKLIGLTHVTGDKARALVVVETSAIPPAFIFSDELEITCT